MAFKNGSSVHAAVLAVQHKACGQQEQAAEGSAHHRQPVCTGLGQNGSSGSSSGGSSSGFRLCILHHVLCVCRYDSSVSGGVCGGSVSRGSDVLHRGIRGHGGVCRGHLRGGRDVRGAGGVRLVGGVRFTGFRGQFGQRLAGRLTAFINGADQVNVAVLFQRGLLVLTLRFSFQSCRSSSSSFLVSMLGSSSMYFAVVDDLGEVTFVRVFVREGVLLSAMKCIIIKCFGRIISASAQSSVAVEIDDSGIVFAQIGRAILVVFCALRWADSIIFMCRRVVMIGGAN